MCIRDSNINNVSMDNNMTKSIDKMNGFINYNIRGKSIYFSSNNLKDKNGHLMSISGKRISKYPSLKIKLSTNIKEIARTIYPGIEKDILEICETKLKDLEKINLRVENLKPKINTDILWKSWTILRAKSIYEDTLAMNIIDISSMTYQAIWEYNKGKEIKAEDLKIALNQKQECLNQINLMFENFDFLVLPSAQIFPFDKNLQFPKNINNKELDTYHRWLEIFTLSSLLELPTITVPVGFDEKGMPMGMQIIGKNKSDLKLFAFAKKYEEIFNFSNFKPLLD